MSTIARLIVCAAILCIPQTAYAQSKELLAGKIWNVNEARFVPFSKMLKHLLTKQYIIVGERHGRTAHQGREAFIIGALAESGRYPTIAFEMLDHTQSMVIAEYRKKAPEYALGLGIALNWAESNWPSWSYYQPVFDTAFATKAEIVGADLTEDEQRDIETRPISEEVRQNPGFQYYKSHMTKAHCGLIDEEKAEKLALLQLERDASMVKSVKSNAHPDHGILLIVGASHVRKSSGIPSQLPEEKTAIVLLRETSENMSDFLTPFQNIVEGDVQDFDYIWFTPKIDETTLCDRIGKQNEN